MLRNSALIVLFVSATCFIWSFSCETSTSTAPLSLSSMNLHPHVRVNRAILAESLSTAERKCREQCVYNRESLYRAENKRVIKYHIVLLFCHFRLFCF